MLLIYLTPPFVSICKLGKCEKGGLGMVGASVCVGFCRVSTKSVYLRGSNSNEKVTTHTANEDIFKSPLTSG